MDNFLFWQEPRTLLQDFGSLCVLLGAIACIVIIINGSINLALGLIGFGGLLRYAGVIKVKQVHRRGKK